jgi:predicted glycogen debranching enzyme
MNLDAKILHNVDEALKLEWLVTNGLGGYASSTPIGVNTRKYHGLLVAALNPPTYRHVVLSKLDEEIQIENRTYKLGTNEFRDTFYPKPEGLLQEFSLNPFPVFKYKTQEIELQKTVFMETGQNATTVTYDVKNISSNPAIVRIFPLINFRHFYHTTHRAQLNWQFTQNAMEKTTTFEFTPSKKVLLLAANKGKYLAGQGVWIENILLRVDAERKEDCLDDCFSPGKFEFQVNPKEQERFSITAIVDENEQKANNLLQKMGQSDPYSQEVKNRIDLFANFQNRNADTQLDDWLKWLVLTANTFVVTRASTKGKSVIAGYHWFEDWGRDTLISLPGLTLINGRFDDAKEILLTFAQNCDHGVIPNHFPERAGDKPEYNTVDASLWYVNAVWQYLKYTGNLGFVRDHLWRTLQSIIDNYANGTLNNIHMTNDHLISHGPRLTWMDALIDTTPVTPREGKAVEIQALWYNALRIMQHLAEKFDINLAEKYATLADKARDSFSIEFWNPARQCLFDVVTNGQKDPALRPNQVLAASLDYPILDEAKSSLVLNVVQSKLWCLYGLRTLSPDEPNYVGRYGGDWAERNRAYHNGAVWPWLLGPFVTAFIKSRPGAEARQLALEKFLVPFFKKAISDAGLGTISEVYDGNPPHSPNGCIAQAWSIAEPLRALIEDIFLNRPPFERRI